MVTKEFILKVKVDEKTIKEKYPNYRFNFSNVSQFIDFIISTIPENKLKEFGYQIKIEK